MTDDQPPPAPPRRDDPSPAAGHNGPPPPMTAAQRRTYRDAWLAEMWPVCPEGGHPQRTGRRRAAA